MSEREEFEETQKLGRRKERKLTKEGEERGRWDTKRDKGKESEIRDR